MSCKDMRNDSAKLSASSKDSQSTKSASSKENESSKSSSKGGCGCGK